MQNPASPSGIDQQQPTNIEGLPDKSDYCQRSTYALPGRRIRWSISGQLTTIKLVFLMSSDRPVGPLACPARFERATYALEALKMRLNNTKNNDLKMLAFGVASTPISVVSGGIVWSLGGIGRRLGGQTSNLSG